MVSIVRLLLCTALFAAFDGVAWAQPYFARAQVIPAPEANNTFVDSVDVDGDWAVAGGEQRFASPGVAGAFVYRRTGNTWAPFQRLSCPTTGTICGRYGQSVALSGTTLAVSAGGSNLYTGVIWVYEFNGSTWTHQTTLQPPAGKHIGDWMALDGDYLVTSGVVNNSSTGWEAYVFERSGGTWTRRTLVANDRFSGDQFGIGVGLSGDLACVVSGGGNPATTSGSVHVFRRTGGNWTQDGPKLLPSNVTGALVSGKCAIKGNVLAVGAQNLATQGQPGSGRVYVYGYSGAWALQQTLLADASTHGLGASVALSDNAIVAGADDSQTAHFYARDGGSWVERGRDQNPVPNANLGDAVATDGATFMVGGTGDSFGVGVLAVYVPSNTPPNPTGPPGAPTGFSANVSGNLVAFSWTPPSTGAPPTGYTLIARAPGGALLTTLAVGTTPAFSVTAPNGTYVVTVRASNTSGTGPESAPVTVTVPVTAPPPGPPSGLAVSVAGTTATFTWNAPASGGAPTGYVLLAGMTPGFTSPIATLPLAVNPRTTAVGGVPPGTYYVRLVAQNGGGTSAASNEVQVVVAGPTAPGAPVLNPAVVTGHTVNLSWSAGAGGTPTSFVLTATTPGGGVLATVPPAATSASFPNIPSGTYLVRLVAVNTVGTSPASNTITVVVP